MKPGSPSALLARFRASGALTASIYAATTLLSRAVVIVLAPLYTRRLNPVDYGDLSLAQTLVATIPTFVSVGMLAAVSRFFYDGQSRQEGLRRAGAVAGWIVVAAIVGGLVLQAAVWAIPLPGKGLFQRYELSCVIWAATGTLLLGVPLGILRASQRPGAASVVQLIDFVASLGAALVLVAVQGRGLRGALEALAVAGLINGFVAVWFVMRSVPARLEFKVLVEALKFSLPFVPHFVANQLLLITDRWVLKYFDFDAQLGVYSLASQLAAPLSMVVLAWNEAVTPKLGEMLRAEGLIGIKRGLTKTVWSYLRLALGAGVCLLLASPVALVVFGPAYSKALWLLPVLTLALVIESLYYPFSNVLFFAGKTAAIPKVTAVTGAFNVLFNLSLVPFFGVLGALASRILAGTFRSAVMAIEARKILRDVVSAP